MSCTLLREEELLEILYGEAGPTAARRAQQHLALCAACREELAALRALRRDLTAWKLPELARTRLPFPGKAWTRGLAAAAALLLALGGALGLSGSELRYEGGRIGFRLGRGDGSDLRRLLAEQEAHHRGEIAALKASLAAPGEQTALLARVEDMIRESEARQAVLLNASLADLAEKTEAQRRYDLARVSAGLSYLDGQSGQQVARTTELMGYVLQASQQR